MDMVLYERDYKQGLTEKEEEEYDNILKSERIECKYGKKNKYSMYPAAAHRYNSLFPNNHIDINDLRREYDLKALNGSFEKIIHDTNSKERDILRFINHKYAYHIIASIFSLSGFVIGHHGSDYLFPEFPLECGKYKADYLLIGSGSGGHEFILIELEAPNGRTTIKSGDYGEAARKGHNQISDWKQSVDSDYSSILVELEKNKGSFELPEEFIKYDSTRWHYVVVAGLRKDYTDKTYRLRREKEGGIVYLHYDNLLDGAERLLEASTF